MNSTITVPKDKFEDLVNSVKRIEQLLSKLISQDRFESLKETEEIRNNPQLMKDIIEAEDDIKAGRVYDWEDVKKEFGWEKGMHVSDKNYSKSKKTA